MTPSSFPGADPHADTHPAPRSAPAPAADPPPGSDAGVDLAAGPRPGTGAGADPVTDPRSAPALAPAPALPFAPWSPSFITDPYPAYDALRAAGRAHWFEPTRQWLIPHHDDVSALLRDRRLGRTYLHRFTHEEFGREAPPPELEPFTTLNGNGMLDLEAPAHSRIRRLVAKASRRAPWSAWLPPSNGSPPSWSPPSPRTVAATCWPGSPNRCRWR